jgi:hypothetical protein
VDLLPAVLAHVRDQQISREAIDGDPPGVAKTPVEDEGVGLGVADERIVGRHDRARSFADVESQDRAEARGGVLTIPLRIACAAAISRRDVEHAVRSKCERTSVVVAIGLREVEQLEGAGGIGDVRIRSAGLVANQLRTDRCGILAVLASRDVVQVEAPVRRVVGIEGEPEQASLTPEAQQGPDVEEERRGRDVVAILEDVDLSALLHEKEPVAAIGWGLESDREGEPEGWKGPLERDRLRDGRGIERDRMPREDRSGRERASLGPDLAGAEDQGRERADGEPCPAEARDPGRAAGAAGDSDQLACFQSMPRPSSSAAVLSVFLSRVGSSSWL